MSDDWKITPKEALSIRAAQVYAAAEEGAIVEVDAELADFMGAFEEDAMSLEDALESRFDHLIDMEADDAKAE